MYMCTYVYISTYICVCIYIYIYMYGWNEITPITKVIYLYSMSHEINPYTMAVSWGSKSMGQAPRRF